MMAQYGGGEVAVQFDREVADAYEAQATPSAIIIHANRTIGSRVALGSAQIAALVERAARP